MRLLDRHILKELLTPLGVCLSGFLIVWVGFDLLGEITKLQGKGLNVFDIAHLYCVRMPDLLNTILPVALLLAMLYTLTQLGRNQELTAIRSAGVSWWRLMVPLFVVGALGSFALFFLNEVWFSNAQEREEAILVRYDRSETNRVWKTRVNFQNHRDGRYWNIGAFNLHDGRMVLPSFQEYLPPTASWTLSAGVLHWRTNHQWWAESIQEIIRRSESDPQPALNATGRKTFPFFTLSPSLIAALGGGGILISNIWWQTNLSGVLPDGTQWSLLAFDRQNGVANGLLMKIPLGAGAQRWVQGSQAIWGNGKWIFSGVREYLRRSSQDDDPLLVLRDSQEFSMRETPDQIRSELKVSGRNSSKAMHKAWLSIREILDYRRLHPKVSGRDAAFLGTQLHARLAAPWTCFIVVLITIPFGAMPGRRNLFYGVAGSIGIAFCFFVLQRLGFALGQKGTLDPWIAAWLPNLFFGFFGIGMILRLP